MNTSYTSLMISFIANCKGWEMIMMCELQACQMHSRHPRVSSNCSEMRMASS